MPQPVGPHAGSNGKDDDQDCDNDQRRQNGAPSPAEPQTAQTHLTSTAANGTVVVSASDPAGPSGTSVHLHLIHVRPLEVLTPRVLVQRLFDATSAAAASALASLTAASANSATDQRLRLRPGSTDRRRSARGCSHRLRSPTAGCRPCPCRLRARPSGSNRRRPQ